MHVSKDEWLIGTCSSHRWQCHCFTVIQRRIQDLERGFVSSFPCPPFPFPEIWSAKAVEIRSVGSSFTLVRQIPSHPLPSLLLPLFPPLRFHSFFFSLILPFPSSTLSLPLAPLRSRPLNTAKGLGSAVSSPAGYGAEPCAPDGRLVELLSCPSASQSLASGTSSLSIRGWKSTVAITKLSPSVGLVNCRWNKAEL